MAKVAGPGGLVKIRLIVVAEPVPTLNVPPECPTEASIASTTSAT